jgi:hypothetical protein
MFRDLTSHHESFSKVGELDFMGKIILDTTFRGESLSSRTKRVCMLLIRSLSIVERLMIARSKSARFIATGGKGHEEKKSVHKSGRRFDLQAPDLDQRRT